MADLLRLAEHEPRRWQQIQRSERALREMREMRELYSFIRGVQFAGEELPVTIQCQSVDHIEQLLATEIVRLKTQPED